MTRQLINLANYYQLLIKSYRHSRVYGARREVLGRNPLAGSLLEGVSLNGT